MNSLADAPVAAAPPLAVVTGELTVPELTAAAALLARAMRDNPLHLAAIGPDPVRREEAFAGLFKAILRRAHTHGAVLGAFLDDVLVGTCAFTPPHHCEPSSREKLVLLGSIVRHAGLGVISRALHWLGAWAERDPKEPHWHLGPIGVAPEWRGRGVGGALLRAFCSRVDAAGETAYLETDRAENVFIYERFGFTCIDDAEILGVSNWFMRRAPIATGPREQEFLGSR